MLIKNLTPREIKLIKFLQSLDKNKRHEIKVICRGNEPWEIDEVISKTKISLKPVQQDS